MASDESSPWMNSSDRFPPEFQNYLNEEKYLCKEINHRWPKYRIFQAEGQLPAIDGAIERKIKNVIKKYSNICRRHVQDQFWFAFLQPTERKITKDIKEHDYDGILLQFWKAVKMREDQYLLTTTQQPFSIFEMDCKGLYGYRQACRNYEYYVATEAEEEGRLGIPGRVFKCKSFEFTPNVIHYTIQEYPQLGEARHYCIRQIFAFPVFELSNKQYVGVFELITTKFNLLLQGSFTSTDEFKRILTESGLGIPDKHAIYHQGLISLDPNYVMELRNALREICKNPAIRLAQAWEPCNDYQSQFNRDITSISHLGLLLSIYNEDCEELKDLDDLLWWNHIRERQGVAGMAFSSRKLSLCTEISQISIIDYPSKHYAIEAGCNGIFAICLQCNHSGNDVFVLEISFNYNRDVYIELYQILKELKKRLPSFRDSSGQELGEKLPILHISEEKEQIQHPLSHTAITGSNDVGQSNIPDPYPPKEEVIKEPVRQSRKSGIPISLEVIQQQFGKKLDDAAESIGVSRSTLKRACREYKILWWQSGKRKNDNSSTFCDAPVEKFTQGHVPDVTMPSSSKQPFKSPVAPSTSRMQHSRPWETVSNANAKEIAFVKEVTQDQVPSFAILPSSKQLHEPPIALDASRMQYSIPLEIVNIKVVYGNKSAIRFQLSLSSRVEELQQEVVRRLNWINFGTYSIQYIDEDDDWILISCDDDLRQYMSSSTSLGKTTITLYLKPFDISA